MQEEEKNDPEANYLDGSFPEKPEPAAFVACEYPIICDTFGMNVTTSNQFTTRSNLAIGECGETRMRAHVRCVHSPKTGPIKTKQ